MQTDLTIAAAGRLPSVSVKPRDPKGRRCLLCGEPARLGEFIKELGPSGITHSACIDSAAVLLPDPNLTPVTFALRPAFLKAREERAEDLRRASRL